MDQWLWHARFFKTRSLATKMVQAGHLRIEGDRATKASAAVRPGQTLTFPQSRRIRVVRVEALATRRGPASEAQTLYIDLTPDTPPPAPRVGPRPTKKDRRDAERLLPKGDPGALE